jgi:hypothetical protein
MEKPMLRIKNPVSRLAILIALIAASAAAGYVTPDLLRGQESGESIRVNVGPQGQRGPIDVGQPPVVTDRTPPETVGRFRVVSHGHLDTADRQRLTANARLVNEDSVVAMPAAALRQSASFAEPSYLPPGYEMTASAAVPGSGDVSSYELTYEGPRGYSIVVARIVGFAFPYDLERPLGGPDADVDLEIGHLEGREAAFYSPRPGTMGGEARIIVAGDGHVTLVVGDVDGDASTGKMTFQELVRVAESIN